MRWCRRRHHDPAGRDDEARQARHKAEQGLAHEQRRLEEAREVGRALRGFRERNHLEQIITESFTRRAAH